MEEQTIRIGDVLLNLRIDLSIGHHGGVRTAILHRCATCNHIRRHIVREGTTSLNQ